MPSVPKSYPREVLFRHLDNLNKCPMIWLSAPPGYGKTVTISSYLRTCDRPAIWYQCDEGDADIASFFVYATVARERFSALGDASLPVFLPQHFSAIPTFTRNFFRSWFAALPQGTALVLDNWQDVPPDASLIEMLPVIAQQIPEGVTIIVISRNDPPVNLSRLFASERMDVIDMEQLRFSKHETLGFVKSHAHFAEITTKAIDDFYAITQGWPVGITLMLRHERVRAPPPQIGPNGYSQAIFDYLAAEVFDRLDDTVQLFLLKTACLEYLSVAIALRVSENDQAGAILDGLTRQNAFTLYRPASDSYYYHPLFRQFLTSRQNVALGPREQRDWLAGAGRALAAEGDSDAGISLLIRANCWEDAVALICGGASELVEQARLMTLQGWIEALPSEMVVADGWLTYWKGVCQLTTAFMAARNSLEQAYTLFVANGDRLGQMLACTGILQHFTYSYADCRPMLAWIERLERLLHDAPYFSSPRVELHIQAGFLLALCQTMPQHPDLNLSVARLSALVDCEKSLDGRAEGLAALLHFFGAFGRTAGYAFVDAQCVAILDDHQMKPATQLELMWLRAYQLHLSGDIQGAMTILGEGRALARHEGFTNYDPLLQLFALQTQEVEQSPQAITAFSELEPLMRTVPPISQSHFLYVRSIFELGCGRVKEALKYIEEAVPMIRACHWRMAEALQLTGLAEIYCASERYEDAARCLRECQEITAGVAAPVLEFNALLIQAEIARCTNRTHDFTAELARALSIGRQQGYANGFHTGSPLLRKLIACALQLGIEESYCRWVIGKRHFKPPSLAISQWPWPVRIKAMGRLEITIGDAPLTVARKAPRKPLDLLKLLVTQSNGVEITHLMDSLWPDLEGDSARNSLDLALHRLRKMLNSKDAALLSDGCIRLNCDLVWVDTFALERMTIGKTLCENELPAAVEELLTLYRAPLLSAEEGSAPIAAARDRMRRRFVSIFDNLAKRLSASDQWETWASLCYRAIEAEPLEESLHRELIRGLLAQGQREDADLAYQRCEQTLFKELARAPSSSTRRLITENRI